MRHVGLRSEFYTAYTPYQPEVSQGTLQVIYEFQTYMAQLYGMEVSNASMYDGATSLAEAALMATYATKRERVLVADTVHPAYRKVMATYTGGRGVEIVTAPVITAGQWQVTADAVTPLLDETIAALVVQYPSFVGTLDDLAWPRRRGARGGCAARGQQLPRGARHVNATGCVWRGHRRG